MFMKMNEWIYITLYASGVLVCTIVLLLNQFWEQFSYKRFCCSTVIYLSTPHPETVFLYFLWCLRVVNPSRWHQTSAKPLSEATHNLKNSIAHHFQFFPRRRILQSTHHSIFIYIYIYIYIYNWMKGGAACSTPVSVRTSPPDYVFGKVNHPLLEINRLQKKCGSIISMSRWKPP